jgi:succinoglycan biosynthesis protein ExoL
MRIAFFGHDAGDAAVRRRVQAFRDDGLDVTGFMMKRRADTAPDWDNIDLGLTADGAFVQRIVQIFKGARLAAQNLAALSTADVIYARNLDMLACAFLAKRHARLDTPVIYESLDVHRLLTRGDAIGGALRWIEGKLLKRSAGLVVSSPAFLKNHFDKHYAGAFRPYLVENRLASGADFGPRPEPATHPPRRPLRIGWVGVLRCKRSFQLLCELADRLGPAIEIHLHGMPARNEIPDFDGPIADRANMQFHGRFRSPEDLASIYGGLDLVWAGDFMEAGFNSVWLLPNRIYEGGYFGVPAIAPGETETARWIERHACGFILAEPLNETLCGLICDLVNNSAPVLEKRAHLLHLPITTFKQPPGLMRQILAEALQGSSAA